MKKTIIILIILLLTVTSCSSKPGEKDNQKQSEESAAVVSTESGEESEFAETVSVYDVTIGYIPDGLIMEEEDDEEDGIRCVNMGAELGDEGKHIPSVSIIIGRTDFFSMEKNETGSEDRGYQSSINGKDAYMIDYSDLQTHFGQRADGGKIMFVDENITVSIDGGGLSFDEVIKIAENITW